MKGPKCPTDTSALVPNCLRSEVSWVRSVRTPSPCRSYFIVNTTSPIIAMAVASFVVFLLIGYRGSIINCFSLYPRLHVLFQCDWLVARLHEKDVLKCITTLLGELYVNMDSLMHQRESFVTCSDTGRLFLCAFVWLLSLIHSFKL